MGVLCGHGWQMKGHGVHVQPAFLLWGGAVRRRSAEGVLPCTQLPPLSPGLGCPSVQKKWPSLPTSLLGSLRLSKAVAHRGQR